MRNRFSIFALAAAVVLATGAGAQAEGTGNRGQGTAAGSQGSGVRSQKSEFDGHQLVAQAARRLQSEPGISAELRYRIDAYGHQLVGTGKYLQLGSATEKLLKLELRMQTGDRTISLQEIRGDDFYWIRREVPPDPPTLGRVNLRRLNSALQPSSAEAEVLPRGNWMMFGGLPRLLSALDQNFAFGTPKADELQFQADDGRSVQSLPIWTISGKWKPERLAALAGTRAKKGDLPEQLPSSVELVLGRTDDVLPLFPYRITYWQSSKPGKGAAQNESDAPRELLTLELFNVFRKDDIDRREFQYNPGEQEVRDLTAEFAQRLGAGSKVR
jgi:hypothetical protein